MAPPFCLPHTIMHLPYYLLRYWIMYQKQGRKKYVLRQTEETWKVKVSVVPILLLLLLHSGFAAMPRARKKSCLCSNPQTISSCMSKMERKCKKKQWQSVLGPEWWWNCNSRSIKCLVTTWCLKMTEKSHCERSEVRLHFHWAKVNWNAKMVQFGEFLKTCSQTVLPNRSVLIR